MDAHPDKLRQATSPRNVAIILGSIWLGLMTYNALMQVSGLLTIHDYETGFLGDIPYMTLKIWLPWVIVSPLVVLLARRFPIMPQNWQRLVLTHLFLFLCLSLLIGSALSFHYHYREEMTEVMKTYQPWQHVGHYLFGDRLFLYHSIIYTVFIASFNIHNFSALAIQRERDSARLAAQLKESQLRALKMQINPHFLFNTLNGISVLVSKGNTEKATEMIRRLSEFFRSTLDESDRQWVPLTHELDTVGLYLAIEQIRFSDRLTVVHEYDPHAMSVAVPSMILQPLVENAMQHGVAEADWPCTLRIHTKLSGDRLVLRVGDDGAGCAFEDAAFREGIGLTNVRARLRQSYGDDFELNLDGAPERGVEITLRVPTRSLEDSEISA